MYQTDWFMRQIQLAVIGVAKIFGKKSAYYVIEDEENISPSDKLHNELIELVAEGKINEAETKLFERIEPSNKNFLFVALDFYTRLNDLTDDELIACDFSRDEIELGLKDILDEYGISGF